MRSQSIEPPTSTYNERPIRPLPKSRIGARLSNAEADTIRRPPAIPSSSPSFDSPHSQSERSFEDGRQFREVNGMPETSDDVCHRFVGQSLDSDEDEETQTFGDSFHGAPDSMYRYPRARSEAQYRAGPRSSGSSGDGYESFENTNNKKKRKIPGAVPLPSAGGAVDGTTQSVNVPYTDSIRAARSVPTSGIGRERFRGSTGRLSGERRPLANTTNNVSPLPNGT